MCPNNLYTMLAYFWDLPFLHVAIEFVNTHGGPFLILTVSCGILVLPVGGDKCRRDSQRETAQHQFLLNGSHRI